MSRIQTLFQQKPAYIGYLTAGDGGFEHSLRCFSALIDGGIDLLEIGVPFSDPVADGSTICQACDRAIASGMSLSRVFDLVEKLREKSDIPIVLFSYYNPIFVYGDEFYPMLQRHNIDGCLVVDLPLEESQQHLQQCQKYSIDPIFLISPSTNNQRLATIAEQGQGMLYYVCRNGTTGVKSALPNNFAQNMQRIKQHTDLPVVTGFGIADKHSAKAALQHADGFVVGSRFVDAANNVQDYTQLTQLAQSIDPR